MKCSVNFGKPDPIMAREALHGLNIAAEDVIMVGDRLHTDVSMGRRAGMSTALVLTGDSTLAESEALDEAEQPDYVLHTLDQLIPAWAWAEA